MRWSPEAALPKNCLGELSSGPASWAQLGQKAEYISRATAGYYHQVNMNLFNEGNKNSSTDFKYSFLSHPPTASATHTHWFLSSSLVYCCFSMDNSHEAVVFIKGFNVAICGNDSTFSRLTQWSSVGIIQDMQPKAQREPPLGSSWGTSHCYWLSFYSLASLWVPWEVITSFLDTSTRPDDARMQILKD